MISRRARELTSNDVASNVGALLLSISFNQFYFSGIFYIDLSIPVHQQVIRVVLPVIPHQDIP